MPYKLTEEGKTVIKLLNCEYIKAFKEGFEHEQAEEIAMARVVQTLR